MATCSEPTKVCANPDCHMSGKPQPWSDFYAKTKWPDGSTRQPHSQCKECRHAQYRARYKQQPERHREYRKAYYRRNTGAEKARCRSRRERVQSDPEAHAVLLEQRRRRHRKAKGTPEDRYLVERGGPSRSGELLPAEPFAEWLRWVMAADNLDRTELANVLGMTVETVRRILNGRQDTVDLMTVDAALQRDERRTLTDLYPLVLNAQGE